MGTVTTDSMGRKIPQVAINWSGQPYRPDLGESYYGDVAREGLRKANAKLKGVPMTPERKEQLRAAMRYARECMAIKRKKRRAMDIKSIVPPSVESHS
jgi:hypothetical protein